MECTNATTRLCPHLHGNPRGGRPGYREEQPCGLSGGSELCGRGEDDRRDPPELGEAWGTPGSQCPRMERLLRRAPVGSPPVRPGVELDGPAGAAEPALPDVPGARHG